MAGCLSPSEPSFPHQQERRAQAVARGGASYHSAPPGPKQEESLIIRLERNHQPTGTFHTRKKDINMTNKGGMFLV